MKIGVALGGGGAKGLAHIGVLEALEEHGLKPDFVAGTSIGSIVGALYCLEGTAKKLRNQACDLIYSAEFKEIGLDKFYTESDNILERFKKALFEKYYFGTLFFKRSHANEIAISNLFKNLFQDRTFDDLKVPFTCNALDIRSGKEVVFTDGPLSEAVWSSCAIPGVFPPFTRNDMILVDGGVINNIPVDPLRGIGAKVVLAIYLGNLPFFNNEPDTGYRINQRSLAILRYHHDQHILEGADHVINPDVSGFHWADFGAIDELVKRGRESVIKNLKQIRSLKSFFHRLKKFARIPHREQKQEIPGKEGFVS